MVYEHAADAQVPRRPCQSFFLGTALQLVNVAVACTRWPAGSSITRPVSVAGRQRPRPGTLAYVTVSSS